MLDGTRIKVCIREHWKRVMQKVTERVAVREKLISCRKMEKKRVTCRWTIKVHVLKFDVMNQGKQVVFIVNR